MLLPSRGNQWRAGVFGSAGASPSHDRSQQLWQCSLHLRTGFRVDPFLAAEERGRTRKIAWGRQFSVFSNRKACPRWSGCSCRAGGISGVPECSAQRELRPPTIAVNNSGNAVCICAQDFALILFLAAEKRGRTRKIAWVREFSVFSNRKACPRWSGCYSRAGGIGGVPGCSAQRELRLPRIAVNTADNAVCICAQDFALILFFGRGRTRKNAENRMGTGVFSVQ